MFVRIYVTPKKCKKLCGPIATWSAKAQYIYHASLKRYLRDPERRKLHESLKKAISSGEIGSYESFRFILSSHWQGE